MGSSFYNQEAKRILESDNVFGAKHKAYIASHTFGAGGENTPIKSDLLHNMPQGSSVTIDEKTCAEMLKLTQMSDKNKEEYSFLLVGKCRGQEIDFNVMFSQGNAGNPYAANFSEIAPLLESYLNTAKQAGKKDLIVCHGHTHPNVTNYNSGFSLGDMGTYIQMNQENPQFKNKEVELCSCVLEKDDFNFLFYDNETKNYYKFDDVRMKTEVGQTVPLPCYRPLQKNSREMDML